MTRAIVEKLIRAGDGDGCASPRESGACNPLHQRIRGFSRSQKAFKETAPCRETLEYVRAPTQFSLRRVARVTTTSTVFERLA